MSKELKKIKWAREISWKYDERVPIPIVEYWKRVEPNNMNPDYTRFIPRRDWLEIKPAIDRWFAQRIAVNAHSQYVWGKRTVRMSSELKRKGYDIKETTQENVREYREANTVHVNETDDQSPRAETPGEVNQRSHACRSWQIPRSLTNQISPQVNLADMFHRKMENVWVLMSHVTSSDGSNVHFQ